MAEIENTNLSIFYVFVLEQHAEFEFKSELI